MKRKPSKAITKTKSKRKRIDLAAERAIKEIERTLGKCVSEKEFLDRLFCRNCGE